MFTRPVRCLALGTILTITAGCAAPSDDDGDAASDAQEVVAVPEPGGRGRSACARIVNVDRPGGVNGWFTDNNADYVENTPPREDLIFAFFGTEYHLTKAFTSTPSIFPLSEGDGSYRCTDAKTPRGPSATRGTLSFTTTPGKVVLVPFVLSDPSRPPTMTMFAAGKALALTPEYF